METNTIIFFVLLAVMAIGLVVSSRPQPNTGLLYLLLAVTIGATLFACVANAFTGGFIALGAMALTFLAIVAFRRLK